MTRSNGKDGSKQSRRDFLLRAGATATGLALAPSILPERLGAVRAQQARLKIGVIGSGLIGGSVGLRWAQAGHEILFSSRHPEELTDLVERAGARTRAGMPAEAAAFGDIVFIAVPYAALPQVGQDYGSLMRGKVVIECGNPYPRRDGPMAEEALAKGTGVASAEFLPGRAPRACVQRGQLQDGGARGSQSGRDSDRRRRRGCPSDRVGPRRGRRLRSGRGRAARSGARIRSRHAGIRDRHDRGPAPRGLGPQVAKLREVRLSESLDAPAVDQIEIRDSRLFS